MDHAVSRIRSLAADVRVCVGFYTRLPVAAAPRSFADAQWAAPVAGIVVGLVSGAVLVAVTRTGVPTPVAGSVALAAGTILTGALHEDGLADMADGFGGGAIREEKLAIMRDSRVGSFGVLALVFTAVVRIAAMAAIATVSAGLALLALTAAHAASRALIPLFMRRVPPARVDGLSANAGRPGLLKVFVALAIGGLFLVSAGPGFGLAAALLLLVWFVALEHLCRRQIGGQTGDVLGALQQGAEIIVLATASAMLV